MAFDKKRHKILFQVFVLDIGLGRIFGIELVFTVYLSFYCLDIFRSEILNFIEVGNIAGYLDMPA